MKQPPTKELIKHSQEEIDRRILKYEQTFALFDPEHVESDQKWLDMMHGKISDWDLELWLSQQMYLTLIRNEKKYQIKYHTTLTTWEEYCQRHNETYFIKYPPTSIL